MKTHVGLASVLAGIALSGAFLGDAKAQAQTAPAYSSILMRYDDGLMKLHQFVNGTLANPSSAPVVGNGWPLNWMNYPGNWTGDGTLDMLARTADGTMLLFPFHNNTFYHQGGGTQVGHGWPIDARYFPGNWTGDGTDDMLVRHQNGDMYLYIFRNRTFYDHAGTKVASAWEWNAMYHLVEDWTGDGIDDFILRRPNGDLVLLPFRNNTFDNNANVVLGTGFPQNAHYFAGHWTGDGSPDLLIIDKVGPTAGTARLYPIHNGVLVPGAGTIVGQGFSQLSRYYVGDWTGDGIDDLLARNDNGDLRLYPFNDTFANDGGTLVGRLDPGLYLPGHWTPGARATPQPRALPGPPTGLATDALTTRGPAPADRADIVNGLMLTRLEAVLYKTTTVGQVNAALAPVGGQISNMRPGDLHLTVSIPRQPNVAALNALIAQLRSSPAFRFVFPLREAKVSVLPPGGAAEPARRGEISHLLPTLFPAAWNAQQAAEDCALQGTDLYVLDYFKPELPPEMLSFFEQVTFFSPHYPPGSDKAYAAIPNLNTSAHGYNVSTFITAAFDDTYPTASAPTTLCTNVHGSSIVGIGEAEIPQYLRDQVGNRKAIVNLSFGHEWIECPTGTCLAEEYASEMPEMLEQRVVQALHTIKAMTGIQNNLLLVSSSGNNADDVSTEPYRGMKMAEWGGLFKLAARMSGKSFVAWTNEWKLDLTNWTADISFPTYPSLLPTDETIAKLRAYATDLGIDINQPLQVPATLLVGATTTGEDRETLQEAAFSNIDPDLHMPAVSVPSLTGEPIYGTSFAAPQVAGLASYLWALSPELKALAPAQTKYAILANAVTTQHSLSLVDAYATVLSMDSGAETPTPESAPMRLAILDLNEDQSFEAADLQLFVDKLIDNPDVETAPRTYSRYDLNGDGRTGGSGRARFDLDRRGSERFGAALYGEAEISIEGEIARFSESGLTDQQILCYYAYSPLYTGNTALRHNLLAAPCALAVDSDISPRWDISPVVPLDDSTALAFPHNGDVTQARRLSFENPPVLGPTENIPAETGLSGGAIWAVRGSLTTDPTRRNHVVVTYVRLVENNSYEILIARLNPATQQWEQAESVAQGPHIQPATDALIDEHGNVFIAWLDDAGNLYARARRNNGQWSSTTPMDHNYASRPRASLRNGNALLVWSESLTPLSASQIVARRYAFHSGWGVAQVVAGNERIDGAEISGNGAGLLLTTQLNINASFTTFLREQNSESSAWGDAQPIATNSSELHRFGGIVGMAMSPNGALLVWTSESLDRKIVPWYRDIRFYTASVRYRDTQRRWTVHNYGDPGAEISAQIRQSTLTHTSDGRFWVSLMTSSGITADLSRMQLLRTVGESKVLGFPAQFHNTFTCVSNEVIDDRCNTVGFLMPSGKAFQSWNATGHLDVAPLWYTRFRGHQFWTTD